MHVYAAPEKPARLQNTHVRPSNAPDMSTFGAGLGNTSTSCSAACPSGSLPLAKHSAHMSVLGQIKHLKRFPVSAGPPGRLQPSHHTKSGAAGAAEERARAGGKGGKEEGKKGRGENGGAGGA